MESRSRRAKQAPSGKEKWDGGGVGGSGGLFLGTSKVEDRIWLAGFLALLPYKMHWGQNSGSR